MSVAAIDRGGICELRLDAPPGNVMDTALCRGLLKEIRERAPDPHLKAFLFTASGKHFSYGASVPEHESGKVEKFLPAFHELFHALVDAGVPCIGAVQGLCLGGAFEWISFCGVVIAEEDAAFGVPEITLGVLPPVACLLLPWRAGGGVAEDLILTGRKLPAPEAQRCGIVNRLCGKGGLAAATESFLNEEIRPRSAAALRLAWRAARESLHREIRVRLPELERFYLDKVMSTRDAHEGIRAFLEKRKPTWVDA